MAVRYNKLWKILIDKKMKKKDLQEAARLTRYQMLKLARDENITTDVVGSICKALDCTPDDIMEFYDYSPFYWTIRVLKYNYIDLRVKFFIVRERGIIYVVYTM